MIPHGLRRAMQNEPIQSHAPPADTRPQALTDEEFDLLCRDWVTSETDGATILQWHGIGPGQFWRVQCAANRKQNRGMWRSACRSRRTFLQMMKLDRLHERAMAGTCRTYRTRNGTITKTTAFNMRALSSLANHLRHNNQAETP
jgi:hypothetical protein